MKLRINENNYKFSEDSKGRLFKYETESVVEKIKNMMDISINESNLGRIVQHIDDGCMMISACRGNRTDEENKEKTDELAKDIRDLGFGYVRILGGYIENKGKPDETEVTEESFFVAKPKNVSDESFFKSAIKLCKKYNQDSVLISLPDFTDFGYYTKSGDFDFSPGKKFVCTEKSIGKYFSMLVKGSHRNRKFAFQDESEDTTLEWIAVRHPSSQYQATYMERMNEYF